MLVKANAAFYSGAMNCRLLPLIPLVILSLVPALPAAAETGALQFVLGKLAATEGDAREALASYDQAIAAGPDDPYLRLEYGELLLRLARGGQGQARSEMLERARVQSAAAMKLDPENRDVLRFAADLELSTAESDPQALARAKDLLERLRAGDPGDLGTMTALGQVYMRQQDFAKAAEVFHQAIQNRPQSRMLYPLWVDALTKAGKSAEAEAALRESLAADPEGLDNRLTLADQLSDRGDHRGAVAILEQAPPADRSKLEVRRRLAFELYRVGDLQAATAELEPVLAEEPDFFGGRYLRALLFEAQGKDDEAARELEALRSRVPDNVELSSALARVRERQGQRDEAARVLTAAASAQEAAGKAREAGALRLQLGMMWSRAQSWQAAASAVESLLGSTDDDLRSDALLIYSDALARAGRGEDALAALNRAAGSSPAVVAQRAEVLFRLGRAAEAEAVIAKLVESGDAQALLLGAEVYQRFDREPEAIALLEKASHRSPDSREVAFRLGAAYERGGRRGEAISAFRGLLDRQPDFAPALNYLGYMFAEHGESLDEAVSLTRRAVDLDPGNGAYVDSLGWAYFQRRDYTAAREYLERAAGLMPADATILEHLGDVYVALGDRGRARTAYEKALGLEGDNSAALRRKLSDLRPGS
jgi:tetratricopeptide (TPR) repeat protein